MNKRREISKAFLVMYSLGVLFLVIDAFKSNQIDFAVINILSMIVAIAVLIKFCKPKK
jgi:membrane-bound ClpP family serine protease